MTTFNKEIMASAGANVHSVNTLSKNVKAKKRTDIPFYGFHFNRPIVTSSTKGERKGQI